MAYTLFASQFRSSILALRDRILQICYSRSDQRDALIGYVVVDRALFVSDEQGLSADVVCLLMETVVQVNCIVDVVISGALEQAAPHTAKHASNFAEGSKALALNMALGGVCTADAADNKGCQGRFLDFVLGLTPEYNNAGHQTPLKINAVLSDACRALGFIRFSKAGHVIDYVDNTALPQPSTIEDLICNLLSVRNAISDAATQAISRNRFDHCTEAWQSWFEKPFQFVPFATTAFRQRAILMCASSSIDSLSPAGVYGDVLAHSQEHDGNWMQPADRFAELCVSLQTLPAEWDGLASEVAENEWTRLASDATDFVENTLQSLCRIPPTHFTQHSTGSQGKLLSIPGLVKWYVTQGNTHGIRASTSASSDSCALFRGSLDCERWH